MGETKIVVLLLSSLVLVVEVLELVLVPIISVLEVFYIGLPLRDLPLESVDLFVELLHLSDVVAVAEGS